MPCLSIAYVLPMSKEHFIFAWTLKQACILTISLIFNKLNHLP
ncbi:hypothetical protein Barb4_01916 [Bacteroidales bacterium Barb4]|nr:hypothetical protein Barb4_01916 [Bacteroidales bacterium Barb4]